jgi:anti-sigma B factor antagonist
MPRKLPDRRPALVPSSAIPQAAQVAQEAAHAILSTMLDSVAQGALATVAGSRQSIVVDMALVDFIASIGIRHLVLAAKAVARGDGRLVLLNPSALVTEVLITSGLEQLLPIVRSEDEAVAALRP